jgi:hypothetical protein
MAWGFTSRMDDPRVEQVWSVVCWLKKLGQQKNNGCIYSWIIYVNFALAFSWVKIANHHHHSSWGRQV